MARPRFFRDPIHLQIRFEAVDRKQAPETLGGREQLSWICQNIIDSSSFQRLRFIRQNGLANLVFYGAEHSRFTHSIGVAHTALTMYERVCRNMSEPEDEQAKLRIGASALVHDIGHGAFSHTLEEILKDNAIEFRHEAMTLRYIQDDDSEIKGLLSKIDQALPAAVSVFFDKKKRPEDHWHYKIVSSQMDADRLDYVQRDALYAGLHRTSFDVERIYDLLYHHNSAIAVDRGAIEALESYLVTIDHLYRTMYYHHTVRAATQMLISLFRRAIKLTLQGDKELFPTESNGQAHPLAQLIEHGSKADLKAYSRLTDYRLWTLVEGWQESRDPIVRELSSRLLRRDLFKSISVDPQDYLKVEKLKMGAIEVCKKEYPGCPDAAEYFVLYDDPNRTSYKRYDWNPESAGESIWLVGEGADPCPLEDEASSTIAQSFKAARYFPRLVVPPSVRDALAT